MNQEAHTTLRNAVRGAVLLSCLVLAGIAIAPNGRGTAFAGGEPKASVGNAGIVRVQAPSAAQPIGSDVTVEIWLDGASNLYGIDVRLAFDPDVVNVPSEQVTPLWDVFDANNHFVIKNHVDNDAGIAWYAVTNVNPSEPFTGTGRVCSITFSGLHPGVTDLEYTYVKGSTRDGAALYPLRVDGMLAIERWSIHLPTIQRNIGGE